MCVRPRLIELPDDEQGSNQEGSLAVRDKCQVVSMSTVGWHLQSSGSMCQWSNACELQVVTRELVEGESIGEATDGSWGERKCWLNHF